MIDAINVIGIDAASHRTGVACVRLNRSGSMGLCESTTISSTKSHHIARALEMQRAISASLDDHRSRVTKHVYAIEWPGSYMRTAPPKLIEAVTIIIAPILLLHDRFIFIRPQGWKRPHEEKSDTMAIAYRLGGIREPNETKQFYCDRCDAIVMAWRTAIFMKAFLRAGRSVSECVRLARGRKTILIAENDA